VSFRDRPILEMKVPLTWTAGVAVIIAVVIGVALLLGDRRETVKSQAIGATKNIVDTATGPVSNVLATPGRWAGLAMNGVRDYILAGSQNHDLREQVVYLQTWKDRAIALENENARLRTVLGLKTDPPIPMVTAHVIADSRGPYADTRLADAGKERGVVVGNPVMSERGLVGRVVGVGRGVSRILLLTDIASRTPVLVDRTNARAILTGDGGPNPKLSYMRGQDPVKVGDRILTSGDGGVYPRGLPVGVAVQGLDGTWRVRLDSDSAPIDYIRILQFTDFSQLANDKDLATAALPPLSAKDAAQVAAQAQASAAAPTPSGSAASSQPSAAVKPQTAAKPGKGAGHKPATVNGAHAGASAASAAPTPAASGAVGQ
jgi:rod shape-determining protein MreC